MIRLAAVSGDLLGRGLLWWGMTLVDAGAACQRAGQRLMHDSAVLEGVAERLEPG